MRTYLLKAAAHTWLNVAASKCRYLAQLLGDLHTVVEEQTQFPLVHEAIGISNQTEDNCQHMCQPCVNQYVMLVSTVYLLLISYNSHWMCQQYVNQYMFVLTNLSINMIVNSMCAINLIQ